MIRALTNDPGCGILTNMIGITKTETHHGNPGERRILPAEMRVRLERADNLPPESEIVWWARPLPGYPWNSDTAAWAETVGVGLYADDVDVVN